VNQSIKKTLPRPLSAVLLFLFLLYPIVCFSGEEEMKKYGPQVRDVDYYVDEMDQLVITYNLLGGDFIKFDVSIKLTSDSWFTWDITPKMITGDIGANITGGRSKVAIWDVFLDTDDLEGDYTVEVNATYQYWDVDSGSNSIGYDMVEIPAGQFLREAHSPDSSWGSIPTLSPVTINSSFMLGKTEVTQGQWRRIMGDNPSWFRYCGDNCPVEQVTWFDAVNFCNKLSDLEGATRCYLVDGNSIKWDEECTGYRLPTEAEWEYAARAGTTTEFSTGDCLSTEQANYNGNLPNDVCPGGDYRKTTLNVDSFKPNAWGLYNMHGNVLEWVWDWKANFSTNSVEDPKGPRSGFTRIYRGGGWNKSAESCRSSQRFFFVPEWCDSAVGFRLAK
jgi:formylglycine-generating enzyme required for sulfatase activity